MLTHNTLVQLLLSFRPACPVRLQSWSQESAGAEFELDEHWMDTKLCKSALALVQLGLLRGAKCKRGCYRAYGLLHRVDPADDESAT